MVLLYVETWKVPFEKSAKHEESIKKWILYKRQQLNKEISYFINRFTQERVMTCKFNSFTDFDKTFDILYADEKNIELLNEWASNILQGSWQGTIWREVEIK